MDAFTIAYVEGGSRFGVTLRHWWTAQAEPLGVPPLPELARSLPRRYNAGERKPAVPRCILLFLLLLPAAAGAAPQPAPGIVRQSVTVTSQGVPLPGYVVRPAAGGRHPAVICAHGFAGRAEDVAGICESLARLGYVAMAVDFRDSGKSPGKPGFACGELRDALAAASFLRRQAYVDPSRLAAWGAGMGGTVALLAAAVDPKLKAAVAFMAPTDCAAFARGLVKQNSPLAAPVWDAIGAAPDDDPSAYAARSPLTVANKIKVPLLLIYGGKDPLVPASHGTRLRDAIGRRGVPCQVKVYPDEGNTFADPANAADSILTMVGFLNKQLKNEPPAGTCRSCLLHRMALVAAVQRHRTPLPQDLQNTCEVALAALEAGKYRQADRLLAEATAAVKKLP